MPSHSIFWGDGLFLRPQHFQAVERLAHESSRLGEAWTTPHYYGLTRLVYDAEALANWRVSISECHLRLTDGTQLRFPEDAHLSPVPIPRTAFKNAESVVRVYVGVSELRQGATNTETAHAAGSARYLMHLQEVEDENKSGNPQEIHFRKLNPQILVGDDAARGFDAVPVMQLRLGETAEAPPKVDPEYIPPLLFHTAWPELLNFATSVINSLGATATQLATQMRDSGTSFESGHKEDFSRILKLHAVNSALGGMSEFTSASGRHPFRLYCELCRVVGTLAIFQPDRRIPELPVYDHDNLAYCFWELRKLLRMKVRDPEAQYIRKPFAVEGMQMTVRLNQEWLDPSWSFYMGVESALTSSRVAEMLSEGELGMKAGSSEEVDRIFQFGRAGVKIHPVADAPRVFPMGNWHYFRFERDHVWKSVEDTLNLGIRFSAKLAGAMVKGENRLEVADRNQGNKRVSLAFSLFAIKKSS
jgi:type VI secretion system protein ImpJ